MAHYRRAEVETSKQMAFRTDFPNAASHTLT